VKASILVLDDEPSILEILGQYLGDEDYECSLTTSAREALKLLSKRRFSLLLTDLKMPEMHGIEVVQRAKAIDPDLAVIVVTALLETTNAIDAMRAGADDYLLKPFNLGEISLSVEKALDRRRLVLENRRYQEELEVRVSEATAELERANRELRETKEYLENLLHSSIDAILTLDARQRISYANRSARVMFCRAEDSLADQPLDRFLTGGKDEVRYLFRMLHDEQLVQNYETELVAEGHESVPVNLSLSLVKDTEGAVISTLAICKDITAQKRLEAELKEMSIKDSLTNLYNQRFFYDRLETEIERARRQGHPLSLLLFDIDQFKIYNDCHGHLEGDRVLKTVGQVVAECTREHVDIGFRYGDCRTHTGHL
jgi:PAS domain S-box-containing protein